jgi:hypothetical protein
VLILVVAALQVQIVSSPPLPRVPPPPPPFSRKVEAVALRIGVRVKDEFKRCGDARTNSNARSVEAFGTPRHSGEWKEATLALENALTVCRGLRRALRDQEDFLVAVTQNGTMHDGHLAAEQLVGVWSELEATEEYFATEAPRYRELLTVGWGNPHCAERADGFMPPSSICPKGYGGISAVKGSSNVLYGRSAEFRMTKGSSKEWSKADAKPPANPRRG